MLLTTKEAAARLGIPLRTLQGHIQAGRLAGEKRGRDFLIELSAVERFQPPKKGRPFAPKKRPGRPRKPATTTTTEEN